MLMYRLDYTPECDVIVVYLGENESDCEIYLEYLNEEER